MAVADGAIARGRTEMPLNFGRKLVVASVVGLAAMTSAFQADDPGSNPGPRIALANNVVSGSYYTRDLSPISRTERTT